MDYGSLKKVGNRLGTAAIMVFDEHTCMVAVTLNLTSFFARESCGWCTPCREGFPYLRIFCSASRAAAERLSSSP